MIAFFVFGIKSTFLRDDNGLLDDRDDFTMTEYVKRAASTRVASSSDESG